MADAAADAFEHTTVQLGGLESQAKTLIMKESIKEFIAVAGEVANTLRLPPLDD